MSTVYIETSIVGYLTERSSDAVIFQTRQELTRAWWDIRRYACDLVASQLVLDEAATGDPTAAHERPELLRAIPMLDIEHPDISPLAGILIAAHLLPEKEVLGMLEAFGGGAKRSNPL